MSEINKTDINKHDKYCCSFYENMRSDAKKAMLADIASLTHLCATLLEMV